MGYRHARLEVATAAAERRGVAGASHTLVGDGCTRMEETRQVRGQLVLAQAVAAAA